nr:hypothetical protein JVH1_0768 [Rhodococcus sp. JVH1]
MVELISVLVWALSAETGSGRECFGSAVFARSVDSMREVMWFAFRGDTRRGWTRN